MSATNRSEQQGALLEEATTGQGETSAQTAARHDLFASDQDQDGEGGSKKMQGKKRVLNAELAFKIYSEKISGLGHKTVESCFVGKRYGISSKTVRDIWDRRTWTQATKELWTPEELLQEEQVVRRQPGRPSGSKDTKPRKPRNFQKSGSNLANSSQEGEGNRASEGSKRIELVEMEKKAIQILNQELRSKIEDSDKKMMGEGSQSSESSRISIDGLNDDNSSDDVGRQDLTDSKTTNTSETSPVTNSGSSQADNTDVSDSSSNSSSQNYSQQESLQATLSEIAKASAQIAQLQYLQLQRQDQLSLLLQLQLLRNQGGGMMSNMSAVRTVPDMWQGQLLLPPVLVGLQGAPMNVVNGLSRDGAATGGSQIASAAESSATPMEGARPRGEGATTQARADGGSDGAEGSSHKSMYRS
mmetsp:Transcript_28517/g.64676  ORF Transcript_28517/g.64676 Transcript_28517/m.64676 type:complete len:415 (-) Transcript_28517:83-1327(-)